MSYGELGNGLGMAVRIFGLIVLFIGILLGMVGHMFLGWLWALLPL